MADSGGLRVKCETENALLEALPPNAGHRRPQAFLCFADSQAALEARAAANLFMRLFSFFLVSEFLGSGCCFNHGLIAAVQFGLDTWVS